MNHGMQQNHGGRMRWAGWAVGIATVLSMAACKNAGKTGQNDNIAASTGDARQGTQAATPASAASTPAPTEAATKPASDKSKPASGRLVDRVVLLTVDALRGDQPWTGYSHAKTPALSKLAEESVVFTRGYSVANTTGPSISGMLAVRYPTELERDDCPLAGFTIGEGVAPVLSKAGGWSGAAHGHSYFGGSTAPKGGFDAWKTIDNIAGRLVTEGAVTGPEVTELMKELIKEAPTDKPVWLWAHYLEPHDSYVYHKDFPPSGEPKRGVYDGEVAFVDNEIGKVLQAIEESGHKDRTAVIIAADHGEAFGEHDRYRHGFTVFEEEVHVPLILRIPGQAPKRVDTPRSVMDVGRTVAALLGVQAPSRWRGRSLVEDLDGIPKERPVIVDVPKLMNLPDQQAVLIGKYKVTRLGEKWSVYDLEADPKEKSPLAGAANQSLVAELVGKAKDAVGQIETVPSQACKRQAFRPK